MFMLRILVREDNHSELNMKVLLSLDAIIFKLMDLLVKDRKVIVVELVKKLLRKAHPEMVRKLLTHKNGFF